MAVPPTTSPIAPLHRPYLNRLHDLVRAYPPLDSFLNKIEHEDAGRQLVQDHYRTIPQKHPGRCFCLSFKDTEVCVLEGYPNGFLSSAALKTYLDANPVVESRRSGNRRLFILEDMDPDYVDILGENLGVDPLVFSEQMNTWNYTNSSSIPYRGLPSVSSPKQSFTLRYYEIRTLDDPASIDSFTFQMTFALNRRRYERWRDVDLPLDRMDERHAFVRRCASFWTSQELEPGHSSGWDVVIMVDPGMTVSIPRDLGVNLGAPGAPDPYDPPRTACLILQDPQNHKDRASLWNAAVWDDINNVRTIENNSKPYHDGCPALAPLLFPHSSDEARRRIEDFQQETNRASLLDEQIFYWTRIAPRDLITTTNTDSCNTTYYLLKHLAQHWTNQLELINCTVAMAEYFSDDYQAKTDNTLEGRRWKAELTKINVCTMDINYMRRQMNHFWRAMVMNLERLGVQLGGEEVNSKLPRALAEAQKDFLTIHARMEHLHKRVVSLAAIATDLASLRAAFQGTYDSDFSLRLGLFASTVFPLTLIASMLSMADDFQPGKAKFWIFWACSIPLVILSATLLRYGIEWQYIVKPFESLVKYLKEKKLATAAPVSERWNVRVRAWLGRMGAKIRENSSFC